MSVNRVQVVWTSPVVQGGGLSTFYFNDAVGTPAQQVAAVGAFLTGTDGQRGNTTSWATAGDVATLNVGTGTLEGTTSVTPLTGTGSATGDYMPPQTQGLLRLITSTVVGGRLLRGRLFLPGNVEGNNTSAGAPAAGLISDYNGDAATLIGAANAEWSVWSITHGTLANVATASVWNKWASLRSRRD